MRGLVPLLIGLVACQSTLELSLGPPPRTRAEVREANPNRVDPDALQPMHHFVPRDDLPISLRATDPRFPVATPPPDMPLEPELPRLWRTINYAWHDEDRGQRLEAVLDEFPNVDVYNNGVALLTPSQIWGTPEEDYEDALCEALGVEWEFTHQGQTWEGEVDLWQWMLLDGPVRPYEIPISEDCAYALDYVPADVALANESCTETDELTFFRDETRCRDCLDDGSTWSACVDADECRETGPLTWWWNGVDGQQVLIETHYAYIAACAPDWYSLSLLVSLADEDEAPPSAFDQEAWIGYCFPFWDVSIDGVYYGCAGELLDDSDWHTLAEGAPVRMTSIRPEGSDEMNWFDRAGFAQKIRVDGRHLDTFWAGSGIGPISATTEQRGWGMPPLQLRPDGQDTFARDYVATYALKTTTRRNGCPVMPVNHNRCLEDAWLGPDERGRYRCTELAEPDEQTAWAEDGGTFWGDVDETLVYQIPMLTLASTGLPDPDDPTGISVHVAGSPGYEQFERHAFPHRFEPDLVPYDLAPEDSGWEGAGPLTGHTYRFGKDPDWDIRVVMGATQHRYHRPEGAPE